MAKFTLTQEQENVRSSFIDALQADTLKAMFIDAVAGSGKTSTLMVLVEELKNMARKPGFKAVMVAFNVVIKNELYRRITEMGAPVEAKTTNGLGNGILLEAAKTGVYPAPKLNEDKYFNLAIAELEDRGYFKPSAKMAGQIKKLADFARQTYVEPTEMNLIEIVMHYGFDDISIVDESWETIWQSVKPVIDAGNRLYRKSGEIDFTDQIYLPLKYELAAPMYDLILIDESQDLNTMRLQLAQKVVKSNGLLVFVGDPKQAIQGFTGTDTDVVNTIVRETNAVMMPLSVCWRCDADIIYMAKQLVPHIEGRPNAGKGIVATIDEYKFLDSLQEGWKDRNAANNKDADLVLCRVTAELVKQCLAALRKGKRAVVRGKSIGKAIAGLLDKFAKLAKLKVEQMPLDMVSTLSDQYRSKQVAKLALTKNADKKIAELDDQLETLDALLVAYLNQTDNPTAPDFKVFIDSKFSDVADDGVGTTPIMFSTVHKAKGLEYDRVFILRPDLMPHPAAKIDWQIAQEYNILYVAITRAKHELYFVGCVPSSLKLPETPETMPMIIFSSAALLPEEFEEEPEVIETEETPVLVPAILVEAPVSAETTNETPEISQAPESIVEASKVVLKPNTGGGKNKKRDLVSRHIKISPEMDAELRKLVAQNVDTSALINDLLKAYFDGNNTPEPPENNKETQDKPEISEDIQEMPTEVMSYAEFLDEMKHPESAETIRKAPYQYRIMPVLRDYAERENLKAPVEDEEDTENVLELQHEKRVVRQFYTCLSKRCKHHWGADYRIDRHGTLYRYENGKRITAHEDSEKCPKCGNASHYIKKSRLEATYSEGHKCDDRCRNARGSDCHCQCGGINHGRNNMIGTPLITTVNKETNEHTVLI